MNEKKEEGMKCDNCGKDNIKVSNGILVNMLNSKKTIYFICDKCLNTRKTIEELVKEIDMEK